MGNYSDWSDWGCDLAKTLKHFLWVVRVIRTSPYTDPLGPSS